MAAQTPKQQLTIHPLQALQVAEMVLRELEQYCERKAALPNWSHPHREFQAKQSLFHSRLILGLRTRELVQEMQGAPGYAKAGVTTAYNSATPHRTPAPDLDLTGYVDLRNSAYGAQLSRGSN